MTNIVAIAAAPYAFPLGKWARLSQDRVFSPRGNGFESAGTFNPAVVKKDGKFVMLYRAQDQKGTSSLGYATSDDGIHFVRLSEPALSNQFLVSTTCGSGYILPHERPTR